MSGSEGIAPPNKTTKERKQADELLRQQADLPLPRQADGLLVLDPQPLKSHSRANATTKRVYKIANALTAESRLLRSQLAASQEQAAQKEREGKELVEKVRIEMLDRVRNAERRIEIYQSGNTVRRQLMKALKPDGVTDEQERPINDGVEFSFIIGDLLFRHVVYPFSAFLDVLSREGAPVRLRQQRLDLDLVTGGLTPKTMLFIQQLKQWATPEQHKANQTFMDREVLEGIYDITPTLPCGHRQDDDTCGLVAVSQAVSRIKGYTFEQALDHILSQESGIASCRLHKQLLEPRACGHTSLDHLLSAVPQVSALPSNTDWRSSLYFHEGYAWDQAPVIDVLFSHSQRGNRSSEQPSSSTHTTPGADVLDFPVNDIQSRGE